MAETPAQPTRRAQARRLQALDELRILDTLHEERFDDLIEDLAETLEAPVAFLTLIDAERQWTKSSVGPVARESRLDAFSSLFIVGTEPVVVADAAADERFASSPLVR